MSDRTLHVAKGLQLPLDAVTQTFGILARKGAGKTYTAAVFAEELIGAGLPVVILDPLGAFWGLRSSADGEKAGLGVTILGGELGDVPLEPAVGKVIAELVVEQPGAYILDLSAFESNAAQDRFVTDFAERLYRLKAAKRDPLHLIVDEADSFAPQRPMPGQQRMLGAFEAIVRRGRIRGLGVTLITQRPAVLNKNVLTQIECLVVLQITGPQDRKAIDEWVAGNGTKAERDQLVASLASLRQGEAWYWSPSWLRVFTKVQVRRRRTFDSSRTPEPGEILQPKRMAPVDLDRLKKRMAGAIEKAKADDPKTLRARIAELERDLRARTDAVAPEPEVRIERIEVPVLNGQVDQLADVAGQLRNVGAAIVDVGGNILHALAGWEARAKAPVESRSVQRRHEAQRAPQPAPAPRPTPTAVQSDGRPLGKAERAFLSVLAQFPDGCTRSKAALLAGYSPKVSTTRTALSTLRTAGYAMGSGSASDPLRITIQGVTALGDDVDQLPAPGDELIAWWLARLAKAEAAFLAPLVGAYPNSVSRVELAQMAGYDPSVSTTRTALSRLRTLGLIHGSQELTASGDLF